MKRRKKPSSHSWCCLNYSPVPVCANKFEWDLWLRDLFSERKMQLLPVALTHISCLAPSHLNIWLQDPDTESSVCVGLPSVQITESPRKITVIIETKPATSIQQPAGSSLLSLRSVSAEAFHWNDQTLAQCTALPTAQAAVTRNAKWISRPFLSSHHHCYLGINWKWQRLFFIFSYSYIIPSLCTSTFNVAQPKVHHFVKGDEYWDVSKVTGLTSDWSGWASHWPQLGLCPAIISPSLAGHRGTYITHVSSVIVTPGDWL